MSNVTLEETGMTPLENLEATIKWLQGEMPVGRSRIKDIVNNLVSVWEAAKEYIEAQQKPDPLPNGAEMTVYEIIPIEDTDRFPKDDEFYVLFDNGEIKRFYADEHPFAVATHYLKKTTIPNP